MKKHIFRGLWVAVLLLTCLLFLPTEANAEEIWGYNLNADGNSYTISCRLPHSLSGEVVIPSQYEGKPVTHIAEDAFGNQSGNVITAIIIPDTVVEIGDGAFCYTNVSEINIPNGVKKIGHSVFSGCNALTSVTIPASVASIGNAFNSCENLNKITADVNNPYYCTDSTGALYNKAKTVLVAVPKNVTSFTIPGSVTDIYYCAFDSCKALTQINIPDTVKTINANAFSNCSALTAITIPNSVTSIEGNLFDRCTSLTSVTIPAGVTNIGRSAFWRCTSLTSITIPNGVTSIGRDAFNGCTALTSVTVPDGVTTLCESAFAGCTGLKSVTLGKGLAEIEGAAFDGCTGLTSVTIPDSVRIVGEGAFNGCTALTTVTLGKSVTNVGSGAFSGCSSLATVYLPGNLANVSEDAFEACTALKTVYYQGDEAQYAKINIQSGNSALLSATVIYTTTPTEEPTVPAGNKEKSGGISVPVFIVTIVAVAAASFTTAYFIFRKKK